MRAIIDDNGELEVFTNNKDICFDCEFTNLCPLISAIEREVAILHYENTEIRECGFKL